MHFIFKKNIHFFRKKVKYPKFWTIFGNLLQVIINNSSLIIWFSLNWWLKWRNEWHCPRLKNSPNNVKRIEVSFKRCEKVLFQSQTGGKNVTTKNSLRQNCTELTYIQDYNWATTVFDFSATVCNWLLVERMRICQKSERRRIVIVDKLTKILKKIRRWQNLNVTSCGLSH